MLYQSEIIIINEAICDTIARTMKERYEKLNDLNDLKERVKDGDELAITLASEIEDEIAVLSNKLSAYHNFLIASEAGEIEVRK